MNEGVQNRQRELLKIKNKEINKETKKKGSTQIDKVYVKVDKQESILKTAQKDEELHREYLKIKKEKEKNLTVTTKSDIEKIKKSFNTFTTFRKLNTN